MAETVPVFGALLKQWRAHRHVSQLDLALQAGVSQRHLSFLETGRANPSRAMVLMLARSLDIPLREQNSLLQSAGFSASFNSGDLDEASYSVFRHALQQTLDHAEPYPAIVLDGRWNMVLANQGALRFFSIFIDPFQALQNMGNPSHFQIVRLCMHEAGLQPYIDNWQTLIASFLGRARRALLANPKDEHLPTLIDEILSHPMAPANWHQVWSAQAAPAMEMIMHKDQQQFSLFTMLAHFGAPADITLEELSVELFYPADEATRTALEVLAES
ncbi:MAG: helix-turn-helix domain-containing protein [bacterium]